MTPERQKLADAQAAHAQAAKRLEAIKAIADSSWELTAAPRRKVESAEAALADHRRHAVADMVANRMGETVLDRPNRAKLEADIAAAQAELMDAQEAKAEIARQHQDAQRAVESTGSAVRNICHELLQASPEAAALAEEVLEVEARLIELHNALHLVGGPLAWKARNDAQLVAKAYQHPLHPDWHLLKSANGNALAAEWQAALARLETDASTPLPSKAAKRPLFG
jgi:hypothetical protein